MTLTGQTFFFSWEVAMQQWLQAHVQGTASTVLSFITLFGEELMLILILGFLYFSLDKKLGKRVGIIALFGMCWNTMLKNIFVRRRPYFDHEGIEIRKKPDGAADAMDLAAQGFSFPSGHSTNVVTVYGSLALAVKKAWFRICMLIVILIVGFSRVVLGAHYATDVLAGWALGFVSILVIGWLMDHVQNQILLYAILLATVLPGLAYCKSNDYFTMTGLAIGFMAGNLFEEKCIRFENTRSPLRMVLRVVGALALYLALGVVLKLPFSKEFLESGTMAAHLVRCGRYIVIGFVCFGLYPAVFKVTARLGRKDS